MLGYYIHLYTDYLWNKYFINKIYKDGILTKIDGSKIKYDGNICDFLYKDYDSLIEDVINTYKIDLSFLKENIPNISHIIEEMPMNKLNVVIDKTNELVEKKEKHDLNVMNMDLINEFIDLSKNKIIYKLNEII